MQITKIKRLKNIFILGILIGILFPSFVIIPLVEKDSFFKPKSSGYIETEDFSSESHGTTGLDIDFIDEYHGYGPGSYCDHYINDGPIGDHQKVFYIRDAQGGSNTWSVHYLDNSLRQGMIEFSLWLNPGSSCTSPNYHYLKFRTSDDIIAFEFRFNLKNGDVEYSDGLGWSGNIINLDVYEWYRYEIGFDVSIGKFILRLTDEDLSIQVAFIEDINYKNPVSIEEIYFGTNVGDYSGNSRWDDFRIEDNQEPLTIPTNFMDIIIPTIITIIGLCVFGVLLLSVIYIKKKQKTTILKPLVPPSRTDPWKTGAKIQEVQETIITKTDLNFNFCPGCGYKLIPTMKFCPKCRFDLREA